MSSTSAQTSALVVRRHLLVFLNIYMKVPLTPTQKWMMAAANRTPTLCTRSPTTWMSAALTLALPWLQWPCSWLGLWLVPWETPDWWRISTILHGTTSKLFQETPLWQVSTASSSYSQNIHSHSTAWGYEHDLSVDVIVSIGEPLYGRQDQRCCHSPDGHNWQQHPQDLCRTQQSTS